LTEYLLPAPVLFYLLAKDPGDYLAAPAVVLRGQHVGLFTDRVAAKYSLFARLIFGAMKIVVGGNVAD
jgi:hypothetical protein